MLKLPTIQYSGFLPSNTANQAKLGIISTDAASYQEMGNGTAAWAWGAMGGYFLANHAN